MIHPVPSGSRDVLPDEMREMRAIEAAVRDVFASAGYGEVSTPALEFESVLARGDIAGTRPAHRFLDEHGTVLVLRSDMTLPIARLVATRYPTADPPLRFCYLAPVYRAVRPARGQTRELLQAGIELIGAPAPDGTAEALSILASGLEAAGLQRFRVGLGDASLFPALLDGLGVAPQPQAALLGALVARDFVGLTRAVSSAGLDAATSRTLTELPARRGGPEVLAAAEQAAGRGPAGAVVGKALSGLRLILERVNESVADRMIFDLGLTGGLGYYTGAIFEVYDPALGAPLGRGGRYDELLGRFGRPLPAVGFALDLQLVHQALMGEEGAMVSRAPAQVASAPASSTSDR